MHLQRSLDVRTEGKGAYELTGLIEEVVRESGVNTGLCVLSCMHTSASLVVTENADPAVRRDLLAWMERIAPENDPSYTHTAEGPDDMPAHVRTMLTTNGLQLPVSDGRCTLGTWQGVYIWEHRHRPHQRKITITVHG